MEASEGMKTGGKGSWARPVLIGLFAVQAVLLAVSIIQGVGPKPLVGPFEIGLAALNALAIGGLITRTRWGWCAAAAFVVAMVARYAWWAGGGDGAGNGLITVLGVAAAVFCVADPRLRREHGMAA